jgi:hypothetical protein
MSGSAAHIVKLYAALALPPNKLGPLTAATIDAMLHPLAIKPNLSQSGLNIYTCDEGTVDEKTVYVKGGTHSGGESKGVLHRSGQVAIAFVQNRSVGDDEEEGSIDPCEMMGWLDGVDLAALPGTLDMFPAVGIPPFPAAP